MKLIRNRASFVVGLALIMIIAPSIFTGYQANAQNDIVSEIKARLVQKNVPVRDITIKNKTPFQLEVNLQSKSRGNLAEPDDPIFQQAVHREVAAARRRGSKIDSVRVVLVNSLGEKIYWSDLPVDQGIDTTPIVPSMVEDAAVAAEIRNRVPLNGMVLGLLDITRDADGVQSISLKLSVQDIKTANSAIPDFMLTLSGVLWELRTQKGAQIATYKVDIVDTADQPLLRYVKDYMPSEERESWWQAPTITQEWFPHPPAP